MDPSGYLIESLMGKERSLKFWETKVLDAAKRESTLKPKKIKYYLIFKSHFLQIKIRGL